MEYNMNEIIPLLDESKSLVNSDNRENLLREFILSKGELMKLSEVKGEAVKLGIDGDAVDDAGEEVEIKIVVLGMIIDKILENDKL